MFNDSQNSTFSGNSENEDTGFYLGYTTYVSVYSGTIIGVTIGSFVVALSFFRFAMKIGVNMHDKVFQSLIRAPVDFFDNTPSGK